MKLNMLHAAAFVMALTASSAQAVVVPPALSSFEGYAAIGDYIEFGSVKSLTEVTFSLSSTLVSSAGADLTLYIYDKTGAPLFGCIGADPYGYGCSGSGTATPLWGAPFFDYSFSFSSPLSVEGIVYILSYANSESLTDPEQLKIQLTTDDSTPSGNVLSAWDGVGLDIGPGDIYAEDASSYFPLGFFNPTTGLKVNLTPVAKFKGPQGVIFERAASQDCSGGCTLSFGPTVVPEPATLALLGIGLAGLGYARRRKAAS